ncbi:hypothetical protein CL634_05835 [bacterium]|nr:hypothetical protein [bacterium]
MKIFTVKGCNWRTRVQVDDSIMERYIDMACEASTQGIEFYLNGPEEMIIAEDEKPAALGPFMTSCEVGEEDDDDKTIILLTEHVLRNAGKHGLADEVSAQVQEYYKTLEDES